jgi:hypothetical protein
VCSTARIEFEQATDRENLSGSGNWAFDNGTHALATAAPLVGFTQGAPQLARFALLLAISSVSSGFDPWFVSQQQPSPLTTTRTFEISSRRRIGPVEARKMALEILRRAEADRLAVAQAEAAREIDWEEIS